MLDLRDVDDPRALRALAHPVRLALLEVLTVHGPQTATEAGGRIGESATTCSFHLRQLAKYRFVEEAGGGQGRSRPWRMTTIGMRFANPPDDPDDPEAEDASHALVQLRHDRQLGRLRAWHETQGDHPPRWRRAAPSGNYLFWLTVEELEQLSADLEALLLDRFTDRLTDPSKRPPGAAPVELVVYGYPVERPEGGD
ncbi:MAG: helix-turn-helix domain-containing protein [Actinomycetota bacterium]|nr:helix-turn-helix domain-containing protein [Actinomycetota bacterium]